MSDSVKLRLTVVTQDRQLLDETVDALTVPSLQGELTILPNHIPLFTPLVLGELIYKQGKAEHALVISKGFLDVGPKNRITVMVDSAVTEREISVKKAQEAITQAQTVMVSSRDREELLQAEASLRRALLELRVAQKTKTTTL